MTSFASRTVEAFQERFPNVAFFFFFFFPSRSSLNTLRNWEWSFFTTSAEKLIWVSKPFKAWSNSGNFFHEFWVGLFFFPFQILISTLCSKTKLNAVVPRYWKRRPWCLINIFFLPSSTCIQTKIFSKFSLRSISILKKPGFNSCS